MTHWQFGYLNEDTQFTWSAGSVAKLEDFERIVSETAGEPRIYDGWCYPPLGSVRRTNSETRQPPEVEQSFALPPTHQLTLTEHSLTDCAPFFIALLGFLKGRRLQQQGWQHFYKTPIDSKLCDFLAKDEAIAQTFEVATAFLKRHTDDKVRKLAFGTLHWHLFGQLYEHEFERFDAQYKALDACYKLTCLIQPSPQLKVPHAKRALRMCEHFGVEPPEWVILAKDSSGKDTYELATRRNALAHEAQYAGKPLGFAHPADHRNMELELRNLVARLFLRIIGVDNSYVVSPVNTRSTSLFEIPR